jgi:hypothetical protein
MSGKLSNLRDLTMQAMTLHDEVDDFNRQSEGIVVALEAINRQKQSVKARLHEIYAELAQRYAK